MLTLWGRATSVNVQKPLWALDEYGLRYDHKIVGGKYGGLDDPAFARLTPAGKVPVLDFGDSAVWESHAILRALARRQSEHPLSANMDAADAWMDYGTATMQPPFIALFWQMVRMTPEQRSQDAMDKARAQISEAMSVIETGLKGPFLLGDDLSIADIALGTPMYRLFDIAPDLRNGVPRVSAWVDAMSGRAGWIRHVATSYEELRV